MGAAEPKAQVDTVAVLPIAGVRGRVEVQGIHGIFYKVCQGGEVLKRGRGGWPIAMKSGQEARLRSVGWLPGFQSLYLGNERVYRFGEDVSLAARLLAFLPLAAILWNPVIGALVGIVLFFYGIVSIKNPLFPAAAKIVLLILNSIGAVLLTIVIGSTSGS